MKTFKQFNEESRAQLDEIAPLALIPAALKLGGMALTAYSAGSALNNLRKGKFKQAGLDALGAIPGGRVFKGIRALGGAKNLAKAGSFVQSANRFNLTGLTPNAYAKGVDKAFDVGTKGAVKGFTAAKNLVKGKNNKKADQVKIAQDTNTKDTTPKFDPSLYKSTSISTTLSNKKDKPKGVAKTAMT